jgi:DNA-binding response OmpR family regulator
MRKSKVMIVDDEVEFAATLAQRLSLRGYETRVVHAPGETLAAAEEMKPDVVLLDLKLKGVSGVELLMAIRAFFPGLEVILLTGHLDLENTIEGLRLDAFSLIMKPFDIAELTEKIDAVGKRHA